MQSNGSDFRTLFPRYLRPDIETPDEFEESKPETILLSWSPHPRGIMFNSHEEEDMSDLSDDDWQHLTGEERRMKSLYKDERYDDAEVKEVCTWKDSF